MKKIVLALLFLCLICCSCGKKSVINDDLTTITQRDRLIVGIRNDAPPFGFKDKNGFTVGYDADLARLIAKGILGDEKKVEFVPVTASNRIMKLNSGEVDCLIATMSITTQRQQFLNFSTPYYMAGQAILVRSSSKATSLRDFTGKKLIIVFGSTSEKNLRSNVPEVTVIGYKTYNDAYNALKNGKADGVVVESIVGEQYILSDDTLQFADATFGTKKD